VVQTALQVADILKIITRTACSTRPSETEREKESNLNICQPEQHVVSTLRAPIGRGTRYTSNCNDVL
jgi:hypothetical protein